MVRWHCGGTRTALGSVWRPIHAQPKDESHSDYSKPPPAGGLSFAEADTRTATRKRIVLRTETSLFRSRATRASSPYKSLPRKRAGSHGTRQPGRRYRNLNRRTRP